MADDNSGQQQPWWDSPLQQTEVAAGFALIRRARATSCSHPAADEGHDFSRDSVGGGYPIEGSRAELAAPGGRLRRLWRGTYCDSLL